MSASLGLIKWLAAHDPFDRAVLVCGHHPTPFTGTHDVVIASSSWSDIGVDTVAQILACGTKRVEYVPCDEEDRAIATAWRHIAPSAVGVFVPHRHLRHGPHLTWGKIPLPRRALLGLREEPPFPLDGDDQQRTIAALSVLSARGIIDSDYATALRATGQHLSATGCTACGVCTSACPEGALSLRRVSDGASSHGNITELIHDLGACRSCQRCIMLCPIHALEPADSISLEIALHSTRETLARVGTRTCPKCGAIYPAEEGPLCAVCSYRQEHPFGAALPPELAQRLPASVAQALLGAAGTPNRTDSSSAPATDSSE